MLFLLFPPNPSSGYQYQNDFADSLWGLLQLFLWWYKISLETLLSPWGVCATGVTMLVREEYY